MVHKTSGVTIYEFLNSDGHTISEVTELIYEWRIYEAYPGRLEALNERFSKITLKYFEKHGIKVIGFWTALVGTSNILYYLIAFDDLAHRERAWNAFSTDPDWVKARRETEEKSGGPLTERIVNMILKPTDYSPLK
jgi:hypothetical protein